MAQGRIAACNVISDMYAMGVYEIDTMLMILGVCRDMPQKERDYATTELIHGFSGMQTIERVWMQQIWPMTQRPMSQVVRPS